ncbi:50S ribosomal protein L17 [Candidatus Peregrinibacteria bacterium]|nr:50S ribosomal protein L17 [Candidatus Peregrinibacteria bacterium]
MRHRKRVQKLGLPKEHRVSLLRNLISSLVLNGKIRTTENRAKALAARFGRLMNLVQRKNTVEAIRLLPRYVNVAAAQKKLLDEVKKKYEKRTSGFTRITRIGLRKGDCARLVQIELI